MYQCQYYFCNFSANQKLFQNKKFIKKKEIDKLVLKCIKRKKPRIAKIFKKKNELFRLPDFMTYYKVTIIRTMWYWHKDSHIEMEQNRELSNRFPFIIK